VPQFDVPTRDVEEMLALIPRFVIISDPSLCVRKKERKKQTNKQRKKERGERETEPKETKFHEGKTKPTKPNLSDVWVLVSEPKVHQGVVGSVVQPPLLGVVSHIDGLLGRKSS
jgi:hypothetical protein